MSVPDVICDKQEAECHCSLLPDHDGPHECHREGCDGSWWSEDQPGGFRVVRFPRIGGSDPMEALGALFGGWSDE